MAVPSLAYVPCLLVVVAVQVGAYFSRCQGSSLQPVGLDGGLDLPGEGSSVAAAMGRVSSQSGPSVH